MTIPVTSSRSPGSATVVFAFDHGLVTPRAVTG